MAQHERKRWLGTLHVYTDLSATCQNDHRVSYGVSDGPPPECLLKVVKSRDPCRLLSDFTTKRYLFKESNKGSTLP